MTVSDYANDEDCIDFDKKENYYILRFKRYAIPSFTYVKRLIIIFKHLTTINYSHCILSGKSALYLSIFIHLIKREISLIGILHGSELLQKNPIMKAIVRKSLRKLDKIISVSKYTDSILPINATKNKKRFIIPNGVNTNLINITNSGENQIRLTGSPRLLTVGSITDRKGQKNLIKALPLILNKYPQAHYHCVGLPINADEVLDLAERLNVNTHVSIHGFIPNHHLGSIYKQADILIMLSHNNRETSTEGFGIAILEANLFGTPALGSINTGIEDAIAHDNTGFLVSPFSDTEILNGIDLVLQKKENLSRNAVKWANKHSWENVSNRYIHTILDA